MAKLMVVGGFAALIGTGLGAVGYWALWGTHAGVNGDPPVTVSDGSLHAHSQYDWQADQDKDGSTGVYHTFLPVGTQLTASNTCLGSGKTAVFWHDGVVEDITPAQNTALVVKITHDNYEVDVTVDAAGKNLKIHDVSDPNGTFEAGKGSRHNRRHSRPGDVSMITVTGSKNTINPWTPASPHNPHFTLGFCYQ